LPSTALLASAAAALAAVLLGASFVAARWLLAELPPVSLAVLRFVLAAACLAAVGLLLGRQSWPARRDLAAIALLGIVQFGIFHVAFNTALSIIPASRAAIVFSLVTFGTMALAVATGREQIRPARVAGVLACIGGVAVALADRTTRGAVTGTGWHGDLLILISVACGSLYNVASPRYLERVSPVALTVVAMWAGALFLLPFAVGEGLLAHAPQLSWTGLALLLFLAIPTGGFSFFLWNWALRRTTPTRVAIFLPLSPITATGLGAWLLAEPVGLRFAAGLALVAVGIWLAHLPAGRVAEAAHREAGWGVDR
jgi:drug/metabolite transporter (DMT)-like permease